MTAAAEHAYPKIIAEICDFGWDHLAEPEHVAAAWAYYYFSIQFRENLVIARRLFPDDANLANLEREECNTSNLSPWPGVAAAGEAMDHDEFMRRVLALSPIDPALRRLFEARGQRYLDCVRAADDMTKALSLTSYEDGGLERVFTSMLRAPATAHPVLAGFRHFLSEHIRFDSDPDAGHGAMIRHIAPDDRILPLWTEFRNLLTELVPALQEMRRAA